MVYPIRPNKSPETNALDSVVVRMLYLRSTMRFSSQQPLVRTRAWLII